MYFGHEVCCNVPLLSCTHRLDKNNLSFSPGTLEKLSHFHVQPSTLTLSESEGGRRDHTMIWSMALLIVSSWLWSSRCSDVVTLAAITGRETLQARPKAALDSTKMYGTFCGTHSIVKIELSKALENGYLLFAKQGKVQENLKRFCVGGENDELGDTAVQGFRG